MQDRNAISRRTAVKSSVFGLLAVSLPHIVFANTIIETKPAPVDLFHRYPSIDDKIVAEVVGVSHFNLDRLKELLNKRPELSRATWDWAFGDWETAIGAASHVGRRDIVDFLLSKGARPDIFTFAMMGAYDAVKTMIESSPGIQSIAGPHGITLLQHAKNGLSSEGITEKNKADSNKLISYLESLGNADVKQAYIELKGADKEKYVGDYKYGDGPDAGFTVKINSRKMLALGKLGKNGGNLYQKSEHVFFYQGTSSVEIKFQVTGNKVISLTVHEPDSIVTALKI